MRSEARRQGSREGGDGHSAQARLQASGSLASREGVVVMPAALDNLTGKVSSAARTGCLEKAWLVAVHHSPEHSASFVTWLLAVPPPRAPLVQPGRAAQPWGVKGDFGETKSEPTVEWLELAGFVTVELSSV